MAGYTHNNNNCYKRANNNYLHPYYVPSWNNPLSESLPVNTRNSYGAPRTYSHGYYSHVPPTPVGLTEVLSSYTPGPAIIMMEKKKKPARFSKQFLKLICLCIILMTIAAFMWTRVFAKSEESSFPEPEIERFIQIPLDKENLSGYSYLNSRKIYTNVIFSYDDDEETFVEDVKTFTLQSAPIPQVLKK